MILGFHYHIPAFKKDNKIYMPGYLGLFIDSLAPHYTKILCFMHEPTDDEMPQMDYCICSNNIELIKFGKHSSIPRRLLWNTLHGKNILKEWKSRIDIMLVRASTPSLFTFSKIFGTKLKLLLVSDATEGLDNLNQKKWRLILIKIWANIYQYYEHRLASKTFTMVNSEMLLQKIYKFNKQVKLVRTTTLRSTDFFYRKDTCQGETVKFFFAGRVTRTKGLLEIINAIKIALKKIDKKIVFYIAGVPDKGDNIIDEINLLSEKLGLKAQIIFLGYIPAGDELLTIYRGADIFISASQASSEGFPRTFWEAMASSLPIIATSVSAVPNVIGGCSMLVEPKNVKELSNAIIKLITNGSIRRKNISLGYELAKTNTLDERASEMYNLMGG